MDTGTRTRLGGSAIAAALTILGPLAPVGTGQAAPPAGVGLTPSSSCEALRQWYVDHTIGQVGPYGWGGPIMYAMREAAPNTAAAQDSGAAAGAAAGVTNSATGTNTQEAGVDEPDFAKTDGRLVVRLRGQDVVITDVTGDSPRELATWRVPEPGPVGGLLLVEDHVLVLASQGVVMEDVRSPYGYGRRSTTEIYDLDISSPSEPRLVAHTEWSGDRLSMRQYGDTVRLVTSTGLPDLPFVQAGKGISETQATERNREVVRTSDIQQWLPWARNGADTSRRAVDCSRIYHPSTGAGSSRELATVGIFTLHPGDPNPVSSVAVTGGGADVYSSADRLYVWSTAWDAPRAVPRPGALIRPLVGPRTDVHAFALDGDDTRYLASGSIDGQVRDRWSFDEHDGHLRVAVTWPPRLPFRRSDTPMTSEPATGDNGIVVLDVVGDRLQQVGVLRGLGRNEQVQSVRWFDDLAVLVTFRQMDPLFTVDLSDPENPRALGALELPGFSSYLHPIGAGRLLGLGTAASTEGEAQGTKAAMFDISDPSHARELHTLGLGPSTWLAAADDPHAFTWIPSGDGRGVAITQLEGDPGVHLVALRVGADGALTSEALPSVSGPSLRALPLPDGRVALVGDRVELVGVG